METNRSQGRQIRRFIFSGVAFLASLVTIIIAWDELLPAIEPISSSVQIFLVDTVNWWIDEIIVPRWIVIILCIIIGFTLILSLQRVRMHIVKRRIKRTKYQDLWLYFQFPSSDELPTVINSSINNARCGKCMGRITSTDANRPGGFVRYLKCENSHFVGGKIEYFEYEKILQAELQERKLEMEKQHAKLEANRNKLINDLKVGNITQSQFDEFEMAPAETEIVPIRRGFRLPDVVTSSQELYNEVISDFVEQYRRKFLEKIEVLEV